MIQEIESIDKPVYEKVCYRGDGWLDTGAKIIDKLKSIGGINRHGYSANGLMMYYFIDNENIIDYRNFIPAGYTLKEI